MPLPNGSIGVVNNPLIESPFVYSSHDSPPINPLPPSEDFRITEEGDIRELEENTDLRIT